MTDPARPLYLHGWGVNSGIWSETLKTLPGQAPKLPGYGDVPTCWPYSAEGLADAIANNIECAIPLVGWSMGGMIALALAARHPEKIEKLVLVGTSPCFVNRPGWGLGLETNVVAGFANDLSQDYKATLQRFLSLQARGGEAARQVIGRLRSNLLDRPEPALETLLGGMHLLQTVDLRDLVDKVRCPTLIMHGAHDALCPVAAGHWLSTFIPGARMSEHPRAAHAPFLSHPDWFNTTLCAFLNE